MGYFSELPRHISKPLTLRSLFKKIIGGTKSHVPENIQATLLNAFPEASSVEWATRENYFESVFYSENQEYIARLTFDGKLLEYRINEPLDTIPEQVRMIAEQHGEVMNCISIHASDDEPVFEVIIRDESFVRFMLLVKADGSLISKLKL